MCYLSEVYELKRMHPVSQDSAKNELVFLKFHPHENLPSILAHVLNDDICLFTLPLLAGGNVPWLRLYRRLVATGYIAHTE